MLVGILGPLTIECDGASVALNGTKRRLLLTLLAVASPEPVSTERVVAALWGNEPSTSATATLQTYVYQLRKLLGAEVVRTTPGGYALHRCELDARRFEALLCSVDGETIDARRHRLASALTYWRGEPFAEFPDATDLTPERTRLVELRLAAIADRVDDDLALGHHHAVVAELESLVVEHPLRERFWAQLMIALYRCDRQADALRAYGRLRRQLRDEVGVSPGPALAQLEQQILAHDSALQAPVPVASMDHQPIDHELIDHEPIDRGVFVGRSAEIEHVLARVRPLRKGTPGGVVMLVGEAGIGKTATCEQIASRATADGALVLWGGCVDGPWATPYGAVMEAIAAHLRSRSGDGSVDVIGGTTDEMRSLLSSVTPTLAHVASGDVVIDPREVQLQTLATIGRYIAELASISPVVVVLDDLHWADSGTIAAVRHLARESAHLPVLLLGTFRDDEVGADHPLRAMLGALPRDCSFERVRLRGLTAEDIAAIATAVTGSDVELEIVDQIAADTAGNPFFVHQVIRHPGDGVPRSVVDVVANRLRLLPSSTQQLLRAACVFDTDFAFGVAIAMAGLGEEDALDALDGALDAYLLIPGELPDTYRFVHALARAAIAGELNPSRRIRLHRRAAEVLSATAGTSGLTADAAGQIARHYHSSRSLPGAQAGVAAALVAADYATETGALEHAVELCRAALELLSPGGAEQAELLGRLGLALARAAHAVEAIETIGAAIEAIADACGPDRAADYAVEAWHAAVGLVGLDGRLCARGLELAGDRRDLTWAYLYILTHEGDDLPGLLGDELFVLASRLVMEHTDHPGLGIVLSQTHPTRDEILTLDAWPSARMFGAGEFHTTVTRFRVAADELQRRGNLLAAAQQLTYEAIAEISLGNLDRADEILGGVIVAQLPFTPSNELRVRVLLAVYLLCSARDGGWDALRLPRDDFIAAADEEVILKWADAKIYARMGHRDAARVSIEGAVPFLPAAVNVGGFGDRLEVHDFVEALWLTEHNQHHALAGRLVDERLVRDLRGPMSDMRLCKARLAALDGDLGSATRWFAESRVVLDEAGARPLRAIVDFDEALMHHRLAEGDEVRRAELLDAASRQFKALGMTGWLRRVSPLVSPGDGPLAART